MVHAKGFMIILSILFCISSDENTVSTAKNTKSTKNYVPPRIVVVIMARDRMQQEKADFYMGIHSINTFTR
jgi:hypothetical protein